MRGRKLKQLISKGSTCKAATFVPQRAVAVVSCSDALEHHLRTQFILPIRRTPEERTCSSPASSSWCSLLRQLRALPLHLRQPGFSCRLRNYTCTPTVATAAPLCGRLAVVLVFRFPRSVQFVGYSDCIPLRRTAHRLESQAPQIR